MAPKTESILIATWSELPIDVLDNIITRLDLPVHAVSFSGVCKLWRYVALGMHISLYCKLPIYHIVPKRSPLPMLLHPGCKGPDTHRLYSLNTEKIYGKFNLPELSNKWIIGSGAGWLVTVDNTGPEVTLLNPLTGKKIPLPNRSTLPQCVLEPEEKDRTAYWYFRKVIVCSYQGCFLVVALVSEYSTIRFCRIGDSKWTRLEKFLPFVDDFIMKNGKLYAVTRDGIPYEIDVADPAKVTKVPMSADKFLLGGRNFLVNLCSELVLVSQNLLFDKRKDSPVTWTFNVFKLVDDKSGYSRVFATETGMWYPEKVSYSWVPMENLGHHMVFVGYNYSVALDSRVYPRCKGNCIYFADHRLYEYDHYVKKGLVKLLHHHDVGIFCMGEQEAKHFKQFSKASSPMNMVWLSPNFSSELEMQMLPQ